MGKIQDSLKENLEEIKATLPEALHASLMAEVESAEDLVQMTETEAKVAIESELITSDKVSQSTREKLCELGIEAPESVSLPSEEEQKQNMEEMLAKAKQEAQA